MQTTETMQIPALGEAGEPCAECGAPLAGDQRYCLNCGRRRSGPRVDYRTYLMPGGMVAQDPPPAPPAASPNDPPADAQPDPGDPERDYAPLAAVGGIALLGLMLLVGVLIGKGDAPSSQAPQVIRVAGAEGGRAGGPESAGTGGEASSKAGKTAGKEGKAGDAGAKAVAGGLTGEAAREAEGTVQAGKDDLEALENTSGEDYEDTVKKLPDKIATPGAPPPIDKSKAPGGGDGGVTIE